MNQGDVYWCWFPAPVGRRPVVILTRPSAVALLTALTVAPTTTTIRGIPSEVRLRRAEGMPTDCVVSLDNLVTVPKAGLDSYITRLSRERMTEIRIAIEFALGLKGMG
jgi:mRNA interferase MazF